MKEPKGKTYSVEEADRLFNGENKKTATIIVRMEEHGRSFISRVMQRGKKYMNNWALMAAAYLLIECAVTNAKGAEEDISRYANAPFAERKAVMLKTLKKAMKEESMDREWKEHGN